MPLDSFSSSSEGGCPDELPLSSSEVDELFASSEPEPADEEVKAFLSFSSSEPVEDPDSLVVTVCCRFPCFVFLSSLLLDVFGEDEACTGGVPWESDC